MPTPVSTARQCLTAEAARALDEAVAIASRRGHAQTTSLHLVSALLGPPSSSLSSACARARPTATHHRAPPRLLFKTLDLCFSVALDRLPSHHHHAGYNGESTPPPPVSNSLMAAIKRSQANQRRLPESFLHHHQQQHFQQQQQSMLCSSSSSTTLSTVKVELQQLILSILDDPVVSRVFAEAGYRSWDIKLSIVRPARYPLFLCNLETEQSHRSFGYPLSLTCSLSDLNECCGRIGEVLMRKKGRNPLLIGACARDAVDRFAESVARGEGIPSDLVGLKLVCVEKEVLGFVNGRESEGALVARLDELGEIAESVGVVVGLGELKWFLQYGSMRAMSYVMEQLVRLLKRCCGKLWLIAEAARYETYLKFSMMFPSIEKDLDLHLMPVTSFRPPMGGFSSQNYSLKESFVPFGGFFSSLSDFERPLGSISKYQSTSRCHSCNEKYEQELSAILKGGYFTSVADHFQGSLPSWMQATDICRNKELDIAKAKDGVWNAMHTGLQRKWNEICRRLHCNSPMPIANINSLDSKILGFASVANGKDDAEIHCRNSTNASPHETMFPSKLVEFQKIDPPRWNMPLGVVSEAKSEKFPSQLHMGTLSDGFQQNEGHYSTCALPNLRISEGHASPSSENSVTTDIGLAVRHSSIRKEPNIHETRNDFIQNIPICIPTRIDLNNEESMDAPTLASSCFEHDLRELDPGDFKALWKALAEKVGRQDQAIGVVSRTITRCRTGSWRYRGASLRGDIWFSFLGPDRVAKKRLAMALAELIFGSNQNAICIDLAPRSGITQSTTILGCRDMNVYNMNLRGKTIIDLIAEEINKKPFSVVFLENVDKADPVAQKRLSQAIKTGKFSDSHGRQIGINNVIFVVTLGIMKGDKKSSSNEPGASFEERILAAQCSRFQMVIEHVPRSINGNYASNVLITSRKGAASTIFVEKHKPSITGDITGYPSIEPQHNASFKHLDLNLPVEELEVDTMLDKCEDWLEEFLNQVDESVIFEAFEFNALTDKLLKLISQCFQNAVGHEGHLEIDSEAMEHIVAAVWLSDDEKVAENWVKLVLGRGFFDAHQRYRLSAASVLKLVACEGAAMGEQAPGICLPSRIIIN